jgi:hypothetical protein
LDWYVPAIDSRDLFQFVEQGAMPKLFVAQYGHPLLKGAQHWSLLLLDEHNSANGATAYQVTGSTSTYEIKQPEVVCPEKSTTYMGRIEVGNIEPSRRMECEAAIMMVPAIRGSTAWNCQNWIVEVLAALRTEGFDVQSYNLVELQKLFSKWSK